MSGEPLSPDLGRRGPPGAGCFWGAVGGLIIWALFIALMWWMTRRYGPLTVLSMILIATATLMLLLFFMERYLDMRRKRKNRR